MVESVTPLVELVDLAARRGWTLGGESGGGVMWTRGGDEVVAGFAVSQRVTWSMRRQLYYSGWCEQCVNDSVGVGLPKGDLVSECNGGGRGDAGLRMLRYWLGECEVRGFGDVDPSWQGCFVHR